MSIITVRRLGVVTAGAAAAIAVSAASASAHHCFIPMYSLNEPTSANWFPVSAELGAFFEIGFTRRSLPCCRRRGLRRPACRRAAHRCCKIFEKMTIGDPKRTGRMNPNGANGRGLEYFGAGSPLPEQMVATYVAGADAYDC